MSALGMLPLLGAVLLCGALGCGTPKGAQGTSRPEVPPASGATSQGVAPASQQSLPDDVVRLPTSSNPGAPVFQVGAPRLRLVPEGGITSRVAVALRGRVIAAADGDSTLAIWDVVSGKLLRRIVDPERVEERAYQVVASDSGRSVAVRLGNENYLLRHPYTQEPVKLPCSPYDFSKDETKLLCANLLPQVVDLATMKVIASAPDDPRDKGAAGGLAFSQDDRSVLWAHKGGILRWNYSERGTVESVVTVPKDLGTALIAQRADAAFLTLESSRRYHADLSTGKLSVLPNDGYSYTIAPSGKTIAMRRKDAYIAIDVLGKPATTLVVAPDAEGPLAFDNDEQTFAFVAKAKAADGEATVELRVFEQGRGLRSYPRPTRFAGWSPESNAILERDAMRWLLSPASDDRTRAPLPPAPVRPAWLPAWRSIPWHQGDGSVHYITETLRAGKLPHRRLLAPCERELRVARPQSVEQVLTSLNCPSSEDEDREMENGTGVLHLGWFVGKGWLLEGLTNRLILRDGTGTLQTIRTPPLAGPDDSPADGRFWTFAFSPDGQQLAVIWRRHDLGPDVPSEPDPRRDAMHIAEAMESECVTSCQWEYYLELWSLESPPKPGTVSKHWPKRLWRERLTGAPRPGEPSAVKKPFGPLVFDAKGERLFVGFADGDVLIRTVRGHTPAADDETPISPLVSMHQLAVTKLAPSPDGRWMFSEDLSAEQRLWRIPASQP